MNLKKPKNFRLKEGRACNYCFYYDPDGYGGWYCKRDYDENIAGGDVGDGFQYEEREWG
jgi:hypothetical protein